MRPRIRTVKPELCKHEVLFDLEESTGLPIRYAWIALWTCVDREGRFEWRPRALKAECMPYDSIDYNDILGAFLSAELIEKYEVDGKKYGFIPSWLRHQSINQRESASEIPAPATHVQDDDGNTIKTIDNSEIDDNAYARICTHMQDRPPRAPVGTEGKGREGKYIGGHNASADADANKPDSESPSKKSKRGTRLPDDWTLPADWVAWAKTERPDLSPAKESEKFADYWHAQPGQKGVKLDWLATWRNWIRNARGSPGKGGNGGGDPTAGWKDDLARAGIDV